MSFLEITAIVSAFASITGISVKSLINTPYKKEVTGYIADLETRAVLWAEIDLEVKNAVISSMEDILANSRDLISVCATDSALKKIISNIIKVTIKEISNIRGYDDRSTEGQYKIFMSIQKFRTEMARTLSMLCAALKIEPKKSELKALIINMATVRPRK